MLRISPMEWKVGVSGSWRERKHGGEDTSKVRIPSMSQYLVCSAASKRQLGKIFEKGEVLIKIDHLVNI